MADLVAAVMFSGVVVYAVFAGADFGVGYWDLTAGKPSEGAPLRRLIDDAIGPVWEANHVWLIFVLVIFWTGFPTGFVTVIQTLAVPFWFAGLGIVIRGATFAWRKYSPTTRTAQTSGALFASASLATPFLFGTIAGAIASGSATDQTGVWRPWLTPTSLLGGLLATLTCVYLAGVFLAAHAHRRNDTELYEYLTTRSMLCGGATGIVALAGIGVLASDAPDLFDQLTTRAAPLITASGAAGTVSLWALWARRPTLARPLASAATAAIVAGWGVAQHPWIINNRITIDDSAASEPVLTALVTVAVIALCIVVPPLIYLFRLADRPALDDSGPSR